MKLVLSNEEAYQRKQRAWTIYQKWATQIRRAFFPETAGVSLYMHNWHICGKDKNNASLAEWIEHSTYARYKRIEAELESRSTQREHERHSRIEGFDPFWCPICHPELAKSYAEA